MKLLLCSEFYFPSMGGAQEVVRQIASRLARAGHDVSVATTALPTRTSDTYQGVKIHSFAVSGNRAKGMSGDIKAYQSFIQESNFDLIFIYAAQQWTFDALWDLLPGLDAKKILVPCGYSGLYDAAYRNYFKILPSVLNSFDAIVYHAKAYRDYAFGVHCGLEQLAILIPNGADEVEFSVSVDGTFRHRLGIGSDDLLLLTVGTLNRAKGHLELAMAFEELKLDGRRAVLMLNGNHMPGAQLSHSPFDYLRKVRGLVQSQGWWGPINRLVKTVLTSVGFEIGYFGNLNRCIKRIGCLSDRRVLLCDLPRPELVQAYLAADIFVFASNIEYSPLVLFEASAAGLPFLSVPVGNVAEIAEWTGGGDICPAVCDDKGMVRVEPRDLARAIERLMADPQHLDALGKAGRAAWRTRFNWDVLVGEYLILFQRICAE